MKELTLHGLKHHTFKEYYEIFLGLYYKLFIARDLNEEDKVRILSVVNLFSNLKDPIMRNLGYRMALQYSVVTKDFVPLYDISINLGLIPVANMLKKMDGGIGTGRESFLSLMNDSYVDCFRDGSIVLTEQQFHLNSFFQEKIDSSTTVVAPTSYGKSELIVSGIEKMAGKKVCILVPSKALLAQTRKRVINAGIGWVKMIVSHPEMHNRDDEQSIYVLTQERLSRILTEDKKMYFDVVFVDEAHNMLSGDPRELLLTSVIRILKFRNDKTAFKFLTPFLCESSNLELKDMSFDSKEYKINEYVKSEKIYVADYRETKSSLEFYDHFLDRFFEHINPISDEVNHLRFYSKNKNIVYLNKPKDTQFLAKRLADQLPLIDSDIVNDAVAEIGDSLSRSYFLIYCMQRGVVYHHGSMPDAVRSYAEFLYSNCNEIKYLVSTSTLLEGVNLPIERMFMLDYRKGVRKLSPSQFKNLIGRVSRFGEVFGSNNMKSVEKLLPEVHVIGSDSYGRKDANLHTFVNEVMTVTKKVKDDLDNVLLEKVEINDDNQDVYYDVLSRLENLEKGIIGLETRIVETLAGLKLIENNISEIDPFESEAAIQANLDRFLDLHGKINDASTLMWVIGNFFIVHINLEKHTNAALRRLKDEKAQSFYAMFLDWRIKKYSFSLMIQKMTSHWDSLSGTESVYVGKWGDTTRDNGHAKHYTYIATKTNAEKINLAIVRIKEEDDFLDFQIFRFIEILNDLEMLAEEFYLKCKYGTSDKSVIALIKNGFSRSVAELLLKNYSDYFWIHGSGEVYFLSAIHSRLKQDKIGFMQRYEVLMNVPS